MFDAVGARLHATTMQATGSDASYLECRVTSGPLTVDAVAEGVPQAWYHYNTVVAHQVQTYATPGGIRDRAELPRDVHSLGTEAAWIPAQGQLIATNGTLSAGGSFVTVTITRRSQPDPGSQSLARTAARALLAAAPRGPGQPGPG